MQLLDFPGCVIKVIILFFSDDANIIFRNDIFLCKLVVDVKDGCAEKRKPARTVCWCRAST
jgi:hypothetical protein